MQREGIGRAIVVRAEAVLREFGCAKINLQVREDNCGVIAFYERMGFLRDPVTSLGKRLLDDRETRIRRPDAGG